MVFYSRLRELTIELSDRIGIDVYKIFHFVVLFVLYSGAILVATYFAYEVRWDFNIPSDFQRDRANYLLPLLGLKLLLLLLFGQFRSLISYFGMPDFFRVALALSLASWLLLVLWYITGGRMAPPRGVILIDFVLSMVGICGVRLGLRLMREQVLAPVRGAGAAKVQRVAIAGAGDVGAQLVYDLIRRRNLGLRPVVFVDDNPRKYNQRIHGVPVTGPFSDLAAIIARNKIDKVIITMPSASARKLKEIVDAARELRVATEIVPSFHQLASGEVKIDRIRPVELEDLLGRETVRLDSEGIRHLLQDKVVMVTGAGGSIGGELCRQIIAQVPARLLMVEQSEGALFEIEQELLRAGAGGNVVPLVADILDAERMEAIFSTYRPQIVFHAAAHKHVPMMERQPGEAVKNNSFGTSHLCFQASRHGVQRFVVISTDKAINPTNVMGASKRIAELAMQARQQAAGNKTRFMAVRFGNVLGSSGSVIPTFKKQIAAGGPVTVTHPDVTRYFMTIPEAVGLVLQAATMGEGGDILVLDMGNPVKIVDVARQLIELSGFRPEIDIEITFTGLRPGEKLYEELQHGREEFMPTSHPRVLRFIGEPPRAEFVERCLGELEAAMADLEPRAFKALIKKFVPEYTPFYD